MANNRVEYGFCSGVHHGNLAGFLQEPEATGRLFLDQLGKLPLGFRGIPHLYITVHVFDYRARRILGQQGEKIEEQRGVDYYIRSSLFVWGIPRACPGDG